MNDLDQLEEIAEQNEFYGGRCHPAGSKRGRFTGKFLQNRKSMRSLFAGERRRKKQPVTLARSESGKGGAT